MTDIVVASRDTLLRDPDSGEQWRIVRGRTLADARHPVVRAFPDNWSPMQVDLGVEDDTVSRETADTADAAASELAGELYEARSEANGYRAQLAAIAQLAADRGLVDRFGVQPDHEGWLVELLGLALDNPGPEESDSSEPVPPPTRAGARKPRGKVPAAGDVE